MGWGGVGWGGGVTCVDGLARAVPVRMAYAAPSPERVLVGERQALVCERKGEARAPVRMRARVQVRASNTIHTEYFSKKKGFFSKP